jgi:hypothetical protein
MCEPQCSWCGSTEKLYQRERPWDSAPLVDEWECEECLNDERQRYENEVSHAR